ncbi:sugar phosphate isomerase/epimerase family protein [Novosphingobium cyanobacteriorum]|uniref:Sugar phosphate isomerase/epimerase n=1 Tax=Novosphingobium cyanobacteriorum TaxID=3024215 RepID=A0ABT6CM35_9SPHN|nr:sugar phosphate isomerase/epimerase [Novosphingobium cyanobacteriorum]MDF8333392.1 sugar phosphate isomerase/epimerase [Novosphingobium cyanobacteriorum]
MTLRWSYSLNQWNNGHDRFVLREAHDRAFKTLSASGFDTVEIPCGSGRWEPLGRKDWIERFYGSVAGLRRAMADAGIAGASSFVFNPAEPIFEEGAFGLSVLNPADHGRILGTLVQYAQILPELGGDTMVVRALPNWSDAVKVDAGTMQVAADCWNAVGAMLAGHGVGLALNFDCVTMARSADDIGLLLDLCDAGTIGLSIDTADAVIMGIDPVALFRQFKARTCHVQLKNALAIDTLEEYRLPFPDKFMLAGGGARRIPRWYGELEHEDGLVDIAGFHAALVEHGYAGWVVVESDQSPVPPTSAMLNGWYLRHRLTPQSA